MTHRRYASFVLIVSIALIAIASVFNILVDPYNIFGSPRVSGLNSLKPYAGDRERIGKVYQVIRARPLTLIVGNSRPEIGLNPDLACWPEASKPVFNHAIPGLTVYKQVRYAQHAIANSRVRQIFMGVDFSDFLASGPRFDATLWPAPEESVLRLSVDAMALPRSQFAVDRFVDRFKASVSLETLADSVTTTTRQGRKWLETRTESGFNPAEGIYLPIIKNEGVQALFKQKNREMASKLAPAQTLFNTGTNWSAQFEALNRLLLQTQKDGIELVLFINPYHAEYLLLIDAAGLWPLFEQWKKQLVHTASAIGISLWDFSSFDFHASELVSELPDRNQSLRWFWEPAHYREELGSLMLSKMLEKPCHSDNAPGFGVRLNEHNLSATLAGIRARRDAFVTAEPAVRERLYKLIADHRSSTRQTN